MTYPEFKEAFGCSDEEVEKHLFESCCQTVADCATDHVESLAIWPDIRSIAEGEKYEYKGLNAVVYDNGKENRQRTGDDGVPNGEDWVLYLDEWVIYYLRSMNLTQAWRTAEEGVTLYGIISAVLGDGTGLLNCIY